MKIFLVYSLLNTDTGVIYNYGLGYLAAVLKKDNHSVDYIGLRDREDILALYKRIRENKPDIIGFSVLSYQVPYLQEIVKEVKKISGAFIVCGGVHPTLMPESILEIPGIDAIVRGEGESPMRELTRALTDRAGYHSIENCWFNGQGKIVKNEIRPLIDDLNELPFPDKDCLDYQRVIHEARGVNRFIFSRGCVFDCPYCSNKALSDLYRNKGVYFRQRSPHLALEEIGRDAGKYQFNEIIFDDDSVTLNKKWFYEFFGLYKKQFKYPFRCNVRPGTIDGDMVKLLKEAGATGVAIGIEQGNEAFRKNVLKRNITDRQMIDLIGLLEKNGIRDNYGQVMVGLPFENKGLFLDTVRLCRRLDLKYYVYVFNPYPGTEFGALCKERAWLPHTEYFLQRRTAVIDYPEFSAREIQMCFDNFYTLVRYPCIPLWIPLGLFARFLELWRALKRFRESVKK